MAVGKLSRLEFGIKYVFQMLNSFNAWSHGGKRKTITLLHVIGSVVYKKNVIEKHTGALKRDHVRGQSQITLTSFPVWQTYKVTEHFEHLP